MKAYDWMVEYTPQRSWIEGHGIFVWLAEVFAALGGGLYLAGLYFGSVGAMLAGWLMVVVLKGAFHLAHLGRPSRFWRLFLRPHTSWLARGLLFVTFFAVSGMLHLASMLWFPGTPLGLAFGILAGTGALLVAMYSGFVMNFAVGIPFWNSALLPLLFLVLGILGGLAVVLVLPLPEGDADIARALVFTLVFLAISAFLTMLYLGTATHMGLAARRSVTELTRGAMTAPFWTGAVVCGLALPGACALYMYLSGSAPAALLIVTASGVLIGVFSMNYCLLRGGVYRPLPPGAC